MNKKNTYKLTPAKKHTTNQERKKQDIYDKLNGAGQIKVLRLKKNLFHWPDGEGFHRGTMDPMYLIW